MIQSKQLAALAAVLVVIVCSARAFADEATRHPVRLEAEQPNVTFKQRSEELTVVENPHVRVGVYGPLCTAPCTAKLREGSHRLALSFDDGPPVEAGDVSILGPTTVKGRYESRATLRTVGSVLFFGGVAFTFGGWGLAEAFKTQECSTDSFSGTRCSERPTTAFIFAGAGLTAASMLAGMVLMFQKDKASIVAAPQLSGNGASLSLSGRF